jgi:hypothetical protein
MSREKIITVTLRLSAETVERVDRLACEWGSVEEKTSRATVLRLLINRGLEEEDATDRRRAALRKTLPARIARIREAYTKDCYRVEILDGHGPRPTNQVSDGKRFPNLDDAMTYFEALEVPDGKRKEIQHRAPSKMKYEPIEVEHSKPSIRLRRTGVTTWANVPIEDDR